VYSIDEHFKNKESQRKLFNYYMEKIKQNVGDFKIEALPCCIHLVRNFTFSAVWVKKDRLRIDFALSKKLTSKRFTDITQISANRYVHYLEILDEKGIDEELLSWLREAYILKS